MKYYIIAYEKIPQTFRQSLNCVDNRGIMMEPYDVILRYSALFGIISGEKVERIYLPKGYDATRDLLPGRQFKF